MTEDKGVQGFTSKNFGTAKEVLGDGVRMEEVPEGIRFYMRNQTVDVPGKKLSINLYELQEEEGGTKFRKEHLEKFFHVPDEDEIALKFGPGKYMWIGKWKTADAQERGVMSDTITISEKWRARYEEAQRKARSGGDALPAAGLPALPAPGAAFSPLDIIRVMSETEERAFRNFERMASIFKGNQGDSAASVLKDAYQGASEMMQRAVEMNMGMAKAASKQAEKAMIESHRGLDGDEDGDGEGDPVDAGDSAMPQWLKAFWPHIEGALGNLLSGGPMGAATKTLIINSAQWKEIFQDKEKFDEATKALVENFGEERATKALDVLLNRKKSGKGK